MNITNEEGNPLGMVLAEVRNMAPITVAEIAKRTGLSQSTVRRHLAELESSGLVEWAYFDARADS